MNRKFISLTIGRNKIRKFFINDILYCKADNTYTIIKTINNKNTYLICIPLKKIEELLSVHNFFRINRSYLVNIDYCIELRTGTKPEIILINEEKLIPYKKHIKVLQEKMFLT